MEALNSKQSQDSIKESTKKSKSVKNVWNSVKGVFNKAPDEPQKKYANYKTPKIYPKGVQKVAKTKVETQPVIHRNHKQFLEIDDFTEFLRTTRPKPQMLSDFQKILSANSEYLMQRDHNGKTPFRVAVETNNEEAVEYFLTELVHYLDHHYEKNVQLVLFKAIDNRNLRMIELLLQPGFIVYGEQLKMLNEKGKNASEWALELYKKAPKEHKQAAWNIAYVVTPDLPVYSE